MIITISGTPGSGKSTIATILAEKLNAARIYVGGIRRDLAKEKGLTLMELNEYAKTNPETDVDVDTQVAAQARNLEKNQQLVIVEGRTQFHFLPESVKLFITVNIDEAARRIWNDLQHQDLQRQRNEDQVGSLAEMKESLQKRFEMDQLRYKQYYHLDITNKNYYDLFIDTTHCTPDDAVENILQYLSQHHHQQKSL